MEKMNIDKCNRNRLRPLKKRKFKDKNHEIKNKTLVIKRD